MLKGRALPKDVHQVFLVGERPEFHGKVVVVLGHVVEADQIRDPGTGIAALYRSVCVMSQFVS